MRLLCFLGLIFSFSCMAQDQYQPTKVPKDLSKIWIETGNTNSDTTIIFCQGGPKPFLYFQKDGRSTFRYLPGYENYQVVHLHQSQTYNSTVFSGEEVFTIEMAKYEMQQTSTFLAKAVTYFKEKNKTVIVIGHSFGAFVIQHYLAKHKNQADRIIISAGRLKIPEAMGKDHFKGINGHFEEDGVTYVLGEEDWENRSELDKKNYLIRNRLKAAYDQVDFIKELENADLSKLSYFYAANDQNVGALSKEELTFLKFKEVKVFETHSGHSETWYRVVDAILEGSIKL